MRRAELVEAKRPSQSTRMASRRARRAELEQLSDAGGAWAAYRTLCQFRLGYLAFLVLVCILVFSFTLLMEIFFAIFLPSARADPLFTLRAILLLAILPFALILLSYCFEEAARFFRDAIDKSEGGLPNFRLSLAVCIHYMRHWKEMPDDRVHQELSDLYRGEDEDAAAWQRVVTGVMSVPRRILATIHTNDPFDDAGKEKEDEKRQELELEFERLQLEAAASGSVRTRAKLSNTTTSESISSRSSSDDEDQTASGRWKKAVSAAKSTIVFQQTHFDGPPLDFSTLVIVDVICPYAFEAVTMWTFTVSLLSTMSPVHAFLDYIQCGFFFVAGYLVIWMVCHFCSSRNKKMREFVSNYRRRRRDMSRRLQKMENEARAEYLWLLDLGFRPFEYFDMIFFTGVERMFEFGERVRVRLPWCFGERQENPATESAAEEGRSPWVLPPTPGNCEEDPLCATQSSDFQSGYSTMTSTISEIDPAVVVAAATTEANQPIEAIEGRQHAQEVENRVHSYHLWSKFSYTRRMWILCPLVIVSAVISFSAFYVGWLLMGSCLILLGHTIQRKYPQIFGAAFRSFITSFVVLSFAFFTSTWAVGTFVQGGDFFVLPPSTSTTTPTWLSTLNTATQLNPAQSIWQGGDSGFVAQYPVCSLNFSTLDIVDFALIADAAYGHSTRVQKQSLGERFNGTALNDWQYVARNDERSSHQVWMELNFPKANLTVIAVRGTASATDALEDLHFWFGICIMQVADVFFPFLKQLPAPFVVELLSMSLFRSIMPPPVYTELLAHVEEVRARVGGDRLVLTGHSLGGAMAAMVGAKTRVPAVSFSGPGLIYSRGRFDVDDGAIRDFVLTIKPRHDIVPQVDVLGGMVQEIECRSDNPLACHSTVTHMCELVASCGDKRGRDWSLATQCVEYMQGATPIN